MARRWGVLCALACLAADLPAPLMLGNRQLSQGEYRLAVQSFQQALVHQPRSARAQLGLAKALAGLSRCDEALDLLTQLRARRIWTADAARAEALCRLKTGDPLQAEALYGLATRLAPRQALGWMGLVQVRGFLGDEEGADEAMVRLAGCEQGDLLGWMAAAELSLRFGRADVDGALYAAFEQLGPQPALTIFDAQRWLDLSDPLAAEEVLAAAQRRSMANAQIAFWRAEALRRLGRVEEAQRVFTRPDLQTARRDGLAVAFRVRILVDKGQLEAAAALLGEHPDPSHPEAMASAWYLAVQTHDVRHAETLAAHWRTRVRASDRTLSQLHPQLPGE